jgi:hypothetical protein
MRKATVVMKNPVMLTAAAVLTALVLMPASAGASPFLLSNPSIISGPVTGAAVVATDKPAQWVSGTWWAPAADQHFSNPYTHGGSLPGDYVYRITFDLTLFNPATAVLAGLWTTDNAGSIWLNNRFKGSVGPTAYGYTKSFNFTSDFVSGLNYLDFHVTNEDTAGQQPWEGPGGINPTGLYYEITQATASPIPEPATLTLVGLGLAGLGARKLKQRRR